MRRSPEAIDRYANPAAQKLYSTAWLDVGKGKRNGNYRHGRYTKDSLRTLRLVRVWARIAKAACWGSKRAPEPNSLAPKVAMGINVANQILH
jgi:hypothetical protein